MNPEGDEAIEIDSSEHDSGFEDEMSSYTASIRSSILEYPFEHGRRYHAFRHGGEFGRELDTYCLPNDEAEQDRLDLTHLLSMRSIGEKLFLAPIDPSSMRRILDIGTGTGIWAMAMGDEYPGVEIVGNDLSAIQPSWVPPNVRFVIDDVELPWAEQDPFDFIFCRYMASSIKDWPGLVSQIYEHITPGGWAEFQDYNLNFYANDDSYEGTATQMWINAFMQACRVNGAEGSPGAYLEGWVRDGGFINMGHERFVIPVGPWAKDRRLKELGWLNLEQILNGLEGFSFKLLGHVLGWDHETIVETLAKVREELTSRKLHIQFDLHVVYGQKPL
ncbi:hypothetical protein OQA88_3283 [Cercophora sp. LCS_1]